MPRGRLPWVSPVLRPSGPPGRRCPVTPRSILPPNLTRNRSGQKLDSFQFELRNQDPETIAAVFWLFPI